jgi:hypothetical protein
MTTITKMKIKLLGKTETIFRVLDKDGEVLRVFATQAEAVAYAAAGA